MRLLLTVTVSLPLLLASAAGAQDIQNFRPAASTHNYLTVEGARVPKHVEFIPSLYVNFGKNPLVSREGGEVTETVVGSLVTADLIVALGLVEHLELSLDLPLHSVSGDLLQQQGKDGITVGDIRAALKWRIVGLEKDTGFGVALVAPVTFPSGDVDRFVGAGQFTFSPKLVLEARGKHFSFATNAGTRIRPATKRVEDSTLELGTEVTYGVGMSFNLGSEDALLLLEAYGASPIAKNVDGKAAANPVEALGGLRFFFDPGPVLTLGGGAGLVGDYGSPEFRALVGFGWHDRNYDTDLDGLLDDVDRCVDDPEDKDDFEDLDGCPESDNDKDGVPDVADACPLVAEDKDAWEDEDGCPEDDNDHDKLLDVDDKCPNEAETRNNWEDTDGCPDVIPDTDKDGLLDPQDKCPKLAEDKDNFEDGDGCPEVDNDRDSILDPADKCPNEPEVVNGVDDQDGCPDQGLVKLTLAKIEILDRIYFDFGKATIKAQSFELLNQVAFVLKSNPRIKHIRVEGHTDNKGKAAYNLKLSDARARSVLEYLTAQGVEATRLESKGFGDQMPIEDNRTQGGRDNNRRVEFVIVSQE